MEKFQRDKEGRRRGTKKSKNLRNIRGQGKVETMEKKELDVIKQQSKQ